AQKPTDVDKPFTLRAGGTLLDVAEMVHKELAANLKYARLWGVGRHPGEQIKADFVLQDKDVVELHTA
ncbi:MAG TPA: TGS domain-containing protein, partial [Pirellulales bacterium]